MRQKLLSTKSIILVPILFIIISILKITYDYYDSQNKMYDFIQKQAQTLNQFMIVHRNYYQTLYLNKVIPFNKETLLGLPAFSAFNISETFSKSNHFEIKVQTVSDRARNHKNQADENELKAIDFFNRFNNASEYFQQEEDYYQYATPLFIQQKCLRCHGKREDAPKFVAQRYENAYNYKVGELRGIVSIKVPKKKIGSYFTHSFVKDVIFDMFIVFIVFFIAVYLVKYFRSLAHNLELEVQDKTKELSHNVAFLESYKNAMDESSIVSKSNLEGIITYVNDNFCKISGYTKEEALGQPHSLLKHPDTPNEIFKDIWDTITAKKIWKGILRNRGKYKDYWIDATILPILDENRNIVEYMAIRHDVTQVIDHQKKLDKIANTDTLTGYGNRYKLTKDIDKSIHPALAILNIDNFSQINDFYGHEKGDYVIKVLGEEIAKIIQKEHCKLYHLQGDEYVVFNKDISKESFINKMMKLTSKIASTKITIEEEELHLNLTTAISFEDKNNLLATADMAFKVARRTNKSFIIFDNSISLNSEYKNNIDWTKKIKQAIEEDNIIPVFQPIVNNHTGNWEKYESLVRIKENETLISPYFFLDISKKTKHYTHITKIMIKKSFDTFKDKKVEFSINLTIEDILNDDIQSFIIEMLKSYNLGSRVVFEIVESESIENFTDVLKFIQSVKTYGCKIAIDDFGTGYSNFEYLMKLKADYIKIDGSIIKDICTNNDAQLVVSMIVDFSKKMQMKTIAEFVENELILNKVKELGIDYSQGYFYSEPKESISKQ